MTEAPLLLDCLARRAANAPDAVLLDEVNGGTLTAGEVYDLALRHAEVLRQLGVRSGEAVATLLPNSNESVVSWLGAALNGAVEIPVSTEFRGGLLAGTLRDHGVTTIVTTAALTATVAEAASAVPGLRRVLLSDDAAEPHRLPGVEVASLAALRRAADPIERPLPGPLGVAGGLLTSGTTGHPKCVLTRWGQLLHSFTETIEIDVDSPGEAPFIFTPMSHLIARGLLQRAMVYPSGRAVIRARFSRRSWWEEVEKYRATEAILPAAVAHWLLASAPSERDHTNPMRRAIITPLIDKARQFQERFGISVSISYGSTEVGLPIGHTGLPPNPRSCGRAVRGTTLRIVDPLTGEEVPDGAVGELQVRDDPTRMSAGYLRGPQRAVDGWHRTGDLFRRDTEGYYYFSGRTTEVIRHHAENISPVTIEETAVQHPDVMLAAAVAVVASDPGEDEIKLYVQARPGHRVDLEEVASLIAMRLPKYMVPHYLETVSEFPMTATGKIRRAVLRDRSAVGDGTHIHADRRGSISAC